MKEAYFSGPIFGGKARAMLDNVRSLRARHEEIAFDPRSSALLVLDMQEYFLSPGSHAFVPCGEMILPKLSDLVSVFITLNRPVFFTQHSNSSKEAGMMKTWWKDLLSEGSPDWNLASELDTSKGRVIKKNQYDAFYNTQLESDLRNAGVTQVVIGGVMTHLCCETTARSAFMRGFQVFFLIDGTASYNEAYHQASLLNLSHGFAIPVLVEEIEEAFNR
jgi:nicotinamidase-related amidase